MKGFKRAFSLLAFAGLLAGLFAGTGCMVVADDEGDDGGGSGVCCYYDVPEPVVYEQWEVCDPGWNTLMVGEECAALGCSASVSPACCSFSDTDYSLDTLTFTDFDSDLMDLQFNFTLTNAGAETTHVWVMLCDYLGCEDVVELDLAPGEVYWDRVPNPVLDTALSDFYDCLDTWPGSCWFATDIEVYLGEDCVCSPVYLDYYYEGLYIY